ncbi:hypothetical protein CZ771_11640 [Actinomycetales bacterium JB111]|nr:hypothetical protein CZ771_11640 [Actinomycetales bacterium JB111]
MAAPAADRVPARPGAPPSDLFLHFSTRGRNGGRDVGTANSSLARSLPTSQESVGGSGAES